MSIDYHKRLEEIVNVRFKICNDEDEIEFVEDASRRACLGIPLTDPTQDHINGLYQRMCDYLNGQNPKQR